MLSAASRPVVEATLPVVAEHVEEVARRFYASLFGAHPELLDGTFNRGNQAAGTQPVALAGSVAAFAACLVRDPDLVPERLLARIAAKHASLGVRPDQYAVVHEHLFGALADVLGDAVTAEVAAAWDEVYWLMAHALIRIERGLYAGQGVTPATVWRPWRVVARETPTADVVALRVEPVDPGPVPAARPGQYVSVRVTLPDGVRQPRQYSLTTADDGRTRSFAVKRVHGGEEPDGEVSAFLHDKVEVGDVLELSAPFGEAVLDGDRPLVLVSAGIGITPTAGILSSLAAARSTRPVTVLHADRDAASTALREQVLADVAALPAATARFWFSGTSAPLPGAAVSAGRMDLAGVDLPDGAVVHLCGPLPFMRAVRDELIGRGVPARDVHHEVFGPDSWQVDAAL